jgi:hypothetical protein
MWKKMEPEKVSKKTKKTVTKKIDKRTTNSGRKKIPYDEALGNEICEKIANGMSLRCATEEINKRTPKSHKHKSIITRMTIYNWLRDNDIFYDQYTRARQLQAESFVDEMIDIADDSVNDFYEKELKDGNVMVVADHENVNRARLRVDARKWNAERMRPEKYGNRHELNVGGQPNNPIHIVDFSRYVANPRAGIIKSKQPQDKEETED